MQRLLLGIGVLAVIAVSIGTLTAGAVTSKPLVAVQVDEFSVFPGTQGAPAGKVRFVEGETELTPDEAISQVFWIAPDLEFYGELTAFENLDFFLRARVMAKSKEEIRAGLSSCGLWKREGDRTGSYSSGMKQRLKIALAGLCQPRVLLLDEPGNNLDSEGTALLENFFKQTKAQMITFWATNHPQETKHADFQLELGK